MNNLNKIIKEREVQCFRFMPNQAFFDKIGIGRKRFRQIMRNEVSPTWEELENISKFFNVGINELMSQN